LGQQRPEESDHEGRGEVAGVSVQEDDDLAACDAERAPHRVALASRRSVFAEHVVLLQHARAVGGGDRGGPIARRGVDYQDFVDQPKLAQTVDRVDDPSDRVRDLARRENHADRAGLALHELFGVELVRMEAPAGAPLGQGQVVG
jgi:hypothetical protein